MIAKPTKMILRIITLLFAFMICHALHAVSEPVSPPDEDSNFKSTISVQFGILSGSSSEYAYSKGHKISQLDWDMKPIYLQGATLGARFFKMFYLNLGVWSGFNQNMGVVKDFDFDKDGYLNNFSKHNSRLQRLQIFDFNTGYIHEIFKSLSLTGMLGYHSLGLKASAKDGYIEYPPGSTAIPFHGTGIGYQENFDIFYLGAMANIQFIKIFYAQILFKYDILTRAYNVDYHFRRAIDFYGFMNSGQYISVQVSLGWKINHSASLVFSSQYTNIRTAKGASYSIDLETGIKSPRSSETTGADWNATSFTLSLEHSLKWL